MAETDTLSDFFVFVSQFNPITQHNLRLTGGITSAGLSTLQEPARLNAYLDGTAEYAPFVPDPGKPDLVWIPNPKANGAMAFGVESMGQRDVYGIEFEGERVRLAEFPFLPSRYSCVYAFASEADCELASKRHGWKMEEVRRFSLIPASLNRVHRASMDLSSLLLSWVGASDVQRQELWRLYWRGKSISCISDLEIRSFEWIRLALEQGENWEYLIEGRLVLA